jgi:hypothetical protein
LGLFIGSILIITLISYLTLKNIVLLDNKTQLKKSINLLAIQLKNSDNLDDFASQIEKTTAFRLALIQNDGLIIAASDYKHTRIKNYAVLEEIVGAKKSDYGVAIRYSHTLKKDFIYIAKTVNIHDKRAILRLSTSLDSIFENFYIFWYRMAFAISFFILFSIFYLYRINEKIHYDIEQITLYIKELSNKNYKAVIQTRYFNEFLQISVILKNLAKRLHNHSRQKRKYGAKLHLMKKHKIDKINLSNLIAEIIKNLEKKYKTKKIIFKNIPLYVEIDKAMIEPILITIIDNALKNSQSDIHVNITKNILSVKYKGNKVKESDLKSAAFDYMLNLHHLHLNVKSKTDIGLTLSFDINSIASKKS